MKPSPMPLFNYKKRERHALVSDPQKNTTPNVLQDSIPAAASASQFHTSSSSTNNTTRFDGHNSMSWKDTKNDYKKTTNSCASYTSGNKSQSFGKPPVMSSSKPTVSVPRAPALINHKPGINNRRGSANVTPPSDSGRKYGQSSFTHDASAKGANPSTQARGSGLHRGRGRGGKTSMNSIGGTFQSHISGDNNDYNSGQNFSDNDSNDYSHNNSSAFVPSVRVGGSSSSSSKNPWSNAAPAQNTWKSQGRNNDFHNKPNAVKLQSGNIQSQYGMMKHSNSQSKHDNVPSHPSSMRDRDTSRQLATSNTPLSIFDEEDVSMQPSLKYAKVSSTPLDKSLRMFTCPIKDMQSWSEAGFYDGPVMFEIYGLLISGPADTHLGVGKEFYIRDQSATIRCVFYEIDRELSQLMKGQVHRLVGSMDKNHGRGGGQFKVVSIRKADKEERESCQQSTGVSLNEMDKLARQLDKEQ